MSDPTAPQPAPKPLSERLAAHAANVTACIKREEMPPINRQLAAALGEWAKEVAALEQRAARLDAALREVADWTAIDVRVNPDEDAHRSRLATVRAALATTAWSPLHPCGAVDPEDEASCDRPEGHDGTCDLCKKLGEQLAASQALLAKVCDVTSNDTPAGRAISAAMGWSIKCGQISIAVEKAIELLAQTLRARDADSHTAKALFILRAAAPAKDGRHG